MYKLFNSSGKYSNHLPKSDIKPPALAQHINILTPLMPCFNTITAGALSGCDLICKECLLVILKKFMAPRCRGSLGLVDMGRGWGEGSPIREAVFKRTH